MENEQWLQTRYQQTCSIVEFFVNCTQPSYILKDDAISVCNTVLQVVEMLSKHKSMFDIHRDTLASHVFWAIALVRSNAAHKSNINGKWIIQVQDEEMGRKVAENWSEDSMWNRLFEGAKSSTFYTGEGSVAMTRGAGEHMMAKSRSRLITPLPNRLEDRTKRLLTLNNILSHIVDKTFLHPFVLAGMNPEIRIIGTSSRALVRESVIGRWQASARASPAAKQGAPAGTSRPLQQSETIFIYSSLNSRQAKITKNQQSEVAKAEDAERRAERKRAETAEREEMAELKRIQDAKAAREEIKALEREIKEKSEVMRFEHDTKRLMEREEKEEQTKRSDAIRFLHQKQRTEAEIAQKEGRASALMCLANRPPSPEMCAKPLIVRRKIGEGIAAGKVDRGGVGDDGDDRDVGSSSSGLPRPKETAIKETAIIDALRIPNLQLKSCMTVWQHQQDAADSVLAGSGSVVLMACGAGKTLTSILVACRIQLSTIVLCNTGTAARQFRDEFLAWTNLNPNQIALITSESNVKSLPRDQKTGKHAPLVVVSTYSFLLAGSGVRAKRDANGFLVAGFATDTRIVIRNIERTNWGLLILDEVHGVASAERTKALENLRRSTTLGITATLLREDDGVSKILSTIGKQTFSIGWRDLEKRGFVAKLRLSVVHCDFDTEWMAKYSASMSSDSLDRGRIARALKKFMHQKMDVAAALVKKHSGEKVIVFSDSLSLLDVAFDYVVSARILPLASCAKIVGATPEQERAEIVRHFNDGSLTVLFLSRVGDESLNVPEASVGIQIDALEGSSRQLTQRVGRLMRVGKTKDADDNFAHFYDVVPNISVDIDKANKRLTFLEKDEAYSVERSFATDILSLPGAPSMCDSNKARLFNHCLQADDRFWDKKGGKAVKAERARKAKA